MLKCIVVVRLCQGETNILSTHALRQKGFTKFFGKEVVAMKKLLWIFPVVLFVIGGYMWLSQIKDQFTLGSPFVPSGQLMELDDGSVVFVCNTADGRMFWEADPKTQEMFDRFYEPKGMSGVDGWASQACPASISATTTSDFGNVAITAINSGMELGLTIAVVIGGLIALLFIVGYGSFGVRVTGEGGRSVDAHFSGVGERAMEAAGEAAQAIARIGERTGGYALPPVERIMPVIAPPAPPSHQVIVIQAPPVRQALSSPSRGDVIDYEEEK